MPRLAVRRPNFSRAVRLVIRDVAKRLPELSHVRAEAILVVAGEARRRSRATMKPMKAPSRTARPGMRFKGHDILYTLTLRPLFFRESSAEQRLETIIHELLHASHAFDGTLEPTRRHRTVDAPGFERLLRPLVRRYVAACRPTTLERFAFDGEVLVRQWLEKPGRGAKGRTRYTAAQTFLGPVRMLTRPTRH